MTTNHEHDGEDERQAARRTAHALGQTFGAEEAEVAAELAASPQARQEVEAVEALAARLKEAARAAPPPEPSPELREAVQRRLAELEPAAGRARPCPARPWWRSRVAALALAAACLVALALPIVWSMRMLGPGKGVEVAKQMAVQDSGIAVDQSKVTMELRSGGIEEDSMDLESGITGGTRSVNQDKNQVGGGTDDTQTGRLMFGGGVNSDAGLVGNATLDEQNFDSTLDKQNVDGRHGAGANKAGGGTLALSGSNGYSGGTNISGGKDSRVEFDGAIVNYENPQVGRVMERFDALMTEARHRLHEEQAASHERSEDKPETKPAPPRCVEQAASPGRSEGQGSGEKGEKVLAADEPPVVYPDAGTSKAIWPGANTARRKEKYGSSLALGKIAGGGGQQPSYQGQDTTATDKTRSEIEKDAAIAGLETSPLTRIEVARSQVVDAQSFPPSRRRLKASELFKDAPKKPAEPQKPLETWKPAHVVPNTSRLMVGDKEELPLKGMQVDVRVDGFRARVLIDLYYFNDRPQPLEGNFQLRLPDEASPYFFAFGRTVYQAPQVTANDSMFFKPQQVSLGDTTPEKILALRGNSWEQPKVARMVPREKAALAYRDTVRRRVDPALVEWSGAGVFQCRVFPLAPQSLHRVTIGYDVDLLRVGDDLELRLDLPGQTPATIVDLNIAASDARQVSLDALATASADGQRLSYRLVDPQQRPLVVRLRKPGTLMLAGADEATGSYFATRVGLPLPETPADQRGSPDHPKRAVFLVDTSLSAGPQFPLWTRLLRSVLENNRDSIQEFAVVFFNVETFWWQEKFVANTPENVEALWAYADGLALEGATDLGRALKEAASPAWLKKADGPAPDLFLLSDGAATWGEDRWALLAAGLSPGHDAKQGPSPAAGEEGKRIGRDGKPEVRPPTPNPSPARREGDLGGALFAYRTGLAGGDPRLLAYLAEQTGGAVFSLVGEAEIASASVAHRNRPWRLTGVEMAGGHDLLVAGRPQYVFPGQQLLVVGRLETSVGNALRGVPDERNATTRTRVPRVPYSRDTLLVFTLQQGKATQTISVRMDQVLASELAARTFGQVATSQLEDVAFTPCPSPGGRGEMAAAEPVATAYARHFRVTGRTCSLLMLESEQDYARFNIKPEEDSFVVKDRPAGPMVAKAVAETAAAMSDPKANFLAWYRRLREASAVRFDLPASLDVALEGLPAETFAVTPPPLQCKLRLRKDLPENLRQPWQSGLPDYETLAAEAQRRLTACGVDDALRGLSSLVEDRPGDAALARDLAFSAMAWQRPGEAYHLLRRAGAARTFEPITFHAMAHCLEQMGRADLAMVYYELACGGQWDGRFGDMHNIAQLDYLRFLRRVADGREKAALAEYAKARLVTLAAMQLRDTADLAALIFWNTDGTDVDLHVVEPGGEECFYQHTQTASGGHISRDVTTGYGPELYLLPKAPAGSYRVSAHYFATDANRASTRTKVFALIYEGWGTNEEKVTVKALALSGRSENHELATVKR